MRKKWDWSRLHDEIPKVSIQNYDKKKIVLNILNYQAKMNGVLKMHTGIKISQMKRDQMHNHYNKVIDGEWKSNCEGLSSM